MLMTKCGLDLRVPKVGRGSQAKGYRVRNLREAHRDDRFENLLVVESVGAKRLDICPADLGSLQVEFGAKIEQRFIGDGDLRMNMVNCDLFRFRPLNAQHPDDFTVRRHAIGAQVRSRAKRALDGSPRRKPGETVESPKC